MWPNSVCVYSSHYTSSSDDRASLCGAVSDCSSQLHIDWSECWAGGCSYLTQWGSCSLHRDKWCCAIYTCCHSGAAHYTPACCVGVWVCMPGPQDRLIGKAVADSSTQIHRFIHLFIFCQSHFVPQGHDLAGKAHDSNMFRVGDMNLNKTSRSKVVAEQLVPQIGYDVVNICTSAKWIVCPDLIICAQWQTTFWKTT